MNGNFVYGIRTGASGILTYAQMEFVKKEKLH